VRLADDDMPASSNPALFVTGVNGVDFVQKQIKVTVFNVNPTLQPVTATDVTTTGHTTLNLTFSDPGADSFQVLVDWGDKPNLPPDHGSWSKRACRTDAGQLHAGPHLLRTSGPAESDGQYHDHGQSSR